MCVCNGLTDRDSFTSKLTIKVLYETAYDLFIYHLKNSFVIGPTNNMK